MKRRSRVCLLGGMVLLSCVATALAQDPLLSKYDFIIGIDTDEFHGGWSLGWNEEPNFAFDGSVDTKHLNNGGQNSGLIVTLPGGSAIVQSMIICTANDEPGRTPASFSLYGTNATVVSQQRSDGTAEPWTTIVEDAPLSLPTEFKTCGAAVAITNSNSYTSYKIIFPTLQDNATGMQQTSEIQLFTSTDGTGTNVALNSAAVGIDTDPATPTSGTPWWINFDVPKAIDGAIEPADATRYANFGLVNSGFIVTPMNGPTIVTSFNMATGDDTEGRDPTTWALYGTNDPITSTNDSFGNKENWTLIASAPDTAAALDLPLARRTWGTAPITFTNTTAYSSYKFVVTGLRNPNEDWAMQFNEIQFFGTIVGPALVDPQFLSPTDITLAIDTDHSYSSYYDVSPYHEGAPSACDRNTGTKYLNKGGTNSGLIVTPVYGASVVQSMVITTANDDLARDPASFILYGTNETILSTDNSTGSAENWTEIASGSLSLPDLRDTPGPVVNFANSVSYTSYRLVIPTIKGASIGMQFDDVALYTAADAGGDNVIGAGGGTADFAIAIDVDTNVYTSVYGGGEDSSKIVDGDLWSKYLNQGKTNSGFIITPSAGKSIVTAFRMVTANDDASRDPTEWELYGTDASIVDVDNSWGNGEPWTLIASGPISLPVERRTIGPIVEVPGNTTAYTSYKMVITDLRDAGPAYGMQFAEISFFGLTAPDCGPLWADADLDLDVDQDDFGAFQICYTGSTSTLLWECQCFDRNDDGLVDSNDLTTFNNCWTGPMTQYDLQNLPTGCTP